MTPEAPQDAGPTQPPAVNDGTTQADAESTATTHADADKAGTYDAEAVERIIKKRLDRERKRWEQEREEAEERARMSEAERIQSDLTAAKEAMQAAERRAVMAERQAALVGRVADAKAALRLLDDSHIDDDGNVNVDALLDAYPFLRVTESTKPQATSTTAPSPKPSGRRVTVDDLSRMTPAEINANWDRIRSDLTNQ